eukprot:CAMPEP_0183787688 /NCGR_PEP_ID=MMETSP0739-20130205/67673_1 /TAXON_ID=385413 /ORGANISM="Thalassiosira miniscula, Strain CCMP1093" /LENGTH=99 /DNA_ID=CAMNT_0026031779 /DNA_START=308 /DNA_END=611 /DNA_ORIENTATION=-
MTLIVLGMPLCMPLVAVAYKGEVVVGVIHDPHQKEMFLAMKGREATMNGETIKVGEQATIGDAVVDMGSSIIGCPVDTDAEGADHSDDRIGCLDIGLGG